MNFFKEIILSGNMDSNLIIQLPSGICSQERIVSNILRAMDCRSLHTSSFHLGSYVFPSGSSSSCFTWNARLLLSLKTWNFCADTRHNISSESKRRICRGRLRGWFLSTRSNVLKIVLRDWEIRRTWNKWWMKSITVIFSFTCFLRVINWWTGRVRSWWSDFRSWWTGWWSFENEC